MAVRMVCDYCGDEIRQDETSVTLSVRGERPGQAVVNGYLAHLHTQPVEGSDDEDSCEQKVTEAMLLAISFGPSLESIPTLSGQAVAARRRRHIRPGGASRA